MSKDKISYILDPGSLREGRASVLTASINDEIFIYVYDYGRYEAQWSVTTERDPDLIHKVLEAIERSGFASGSVSGCPRASAVDTFGPASVYWAPLTWIHCIADVVENS